MILPMAMVRPSSRSVNRPSCGTLENSSTQMGFSTASRTTHALLLFTNFTFKRIVARTGQHSTQRRDASNTGLPFWLRCLPLLHLTNFACSGAPYERACSCAGSCTKCEQGPPGPTNLHPFPGSFPSALGIRRRSTPVPLGHKLLPAQ